jgi:hypothetical protein
MPAWLPKWLRGSPGRWRHEAGCQTGVWLPFPFFAELHQSVMNEDEGGTIGLNFPHFQAIIWGLSGRSAAW